MIWHAGQSGRIAYAFTDRTGGSSGGPWRSLNLGTANGDHPQRVKHNLGLVAAEVGVSRLVMMHQVHGRDVAWVDELADDEIPVADALLTDQVGVGVLVRVADCTPIVLAAPQETLAGVVHCGRAGLVHGVIGQAVQALRDRGATTLHAYVGPRACGKCYELPTVLADAIAEAVPATRSTTSWGTPAADIGAGVLAQLEALDVQTTDLGAHECTIEDDRWFSYRRQGQNSGRFGAVAVIR